MRYYYDLTWEPQRGGQLSDDAESNLVILCRRCAGLYGSVTAWAGSADDAASCEVCGGYDDAPGLLPAAAIERLLAGLSGDERARVARLVQHSGCDVRLAVLAIKALR